MSFASMRLLFGLMALAANAVVLGYLVLWVIGRRESADATRDRIVGSIAGLELWLAFGVATVATLGSLYLSDIVGLVPCRLCWFQRIFIYPLVPILGVAAWTRDGAAVRRYVLALAFPGMAISLYHYAIQHFPGLESGACDAIAPCSAAYIWLWGFVSIPYMALSALLLVVVLTFSLGRNLRMLSSSTREGNNGRHADSLNAEDID